jgi:hypothetical protein
MIVTPKPREQTRARYPDEESYVERDGVPALPDVADLALEAVEGADPVSLAPLSGHHVRPTG